MKFALVILGLVATPLTTADRSFVYQALTGNTTEVRQGQIFADSTDTRVAQFAERMANDHSQANQQLVAIAESNGIHVSKDQYVVASYRAGQQSAALSAKDKEAQIKALPPVPYFEKQITMHQQALALYQKELANGSNEKLVAYARRTIPVIQQHLALAQTDLRAEKAQGRH